MAKILCTIWALILHTAGFYIFQTCLSMNDDDDCSESIAVKGHPITAFLFILGIYVIITQISLFPSTFQEPPGSILCLYELLSTFFILEFCLACIWNPLDVLMLSTMPKTISHLLNGLELIETSEWIMKNQISMKALSFTVSFGFLLVSLHVTKAVDFSIIPNYGIIVFTDVLMWNFYRRITNEMPDSNGIIAYLMPRHRRTNRGQQTSKRCKTCQRLQD